LYITYLALIILLAAIINSEQKPSYHMRRYYPPFQVHTWAWPSECLTADRVTLFITYVGIRIRCISYIISRQIRQSI
jgi:hypothetical protein